MAEFAKCNNDKASGFNSIVDPFSFGFEQGSDNVF